MKIIVKEWLKDKKACMLLLLNLMLNILSIVTSNLIILNISKIFNYLDTWKYYIFIISIITITQIIVNSMKGYLKTYTTSHCYRTLVNIYIEKVLNLDYKIFTELSAARIQTAQGFY